MSWYSDKEKGRQNSWRITVPDDIVHREAYRAGMNEAADERRRKDKARLDAAFSRNSSSYSGANTEKSGGAGGLSSLGAVLVLVWALSGKGGDNVHTNAQPLAGAKTSSPADRAGPSIKPDVRLSRGAVAIIRANEGLRVRSCPRPTSDCEIQIKLPRGTKVRVLDEERDGWIKIEWVNERGKAIRGYSDSSYLKFFTKGPVAGTGTPGP
jgi:hypothetical protein